MQINQTILNVELIDIIEELKRQLYANGIQRFAKIVDSGDDGLIIDKVT